jgi:short/branched chain acyl-CoA dehydrogenase
MASCIRRATTLAATRPSVLLRRNGLRAATTRSFSDLGVPTPIFALTETEEMIKESVSKFANEEILPKVREMDEAEQMDKGIVSQLFEQGLMGIEIPEKYGGSEMNFGSCIVAIEELARVDPSVGYP